MGRPLGVWRVGVKPGGCQVSEVRVGGEQRKATGSQISHWWPQPKHAGEHLQAALKQFVCTFALTCSGSLCLTEWPAGTLSFSLAASSADVSCDRIAAERRFCPGAAEARCSLPWNAVDFLNPPTSLSWGLRGRAYLTPPPPNRPPHVSHVWNL